MQGRDRILIVDDDPTLLRVASYNLEQEGFEVFTALDGQAGLKAVFEHRPDLVILDVMMPRLDGFETCRRIRELTNVPILMLTARQQEEDIIRGLELGADDYLVKPFVIGVLIARVKALLRRAQLPTTNEEPSLTYQDDWLRIDLPTRIVEVNGKRVSLSATEFKLLALLLRNAGRILEFNQILAHVWGPEYRDEISYVRVYISHLRQKIEPDPESPTYIQTERQVGYRFVRAN